MKENDVVWTCNSSFEFNEEFSRPHKVKVKEHNGILIGYSFNETGEIDPNAMFKLTPSFHTKEEAQNHYSTLLKNAIAETSTHLIN